MKEVAMMLNHNVCHKTITGLRLELEDAKVEIKRLTELLAPVALVFPASFHLTYCEAIILTCLFLTDGVCKKDRLGFAIANREHGFKGRYEDCVKTVKVHISYLRRKLGAVNAEIGSAYGDGYYLSEEDKVKIREAISAKAVLPIRKYLPTKQQGAESYVA